MLKCVVTGNVVLYNLLSVSAVDRLGGLVDSRLAVVWCWLAVVVLVGCGEVSVGCGEMLAGSSVGWLWCGVGWLWCGVGWLW